MTKEIIFTDSFGNRAHAQIVDSRPAEIPEKRFQGSIDGYDIYSKKLIIRSAFDYIAVKSGR